MALNEDYTQIINFSVDTRINNNQITISSTQIAPQTNLHFLGININLNWAAHIVDLNKWLNTRIYFSNQTDKRFKNPTDCSSGLFFFINDV